MQTTDMQPIGSVGWIIILLHDFCLKPSGKSNHGRASH